MPLDAAARFDESKVTRLLSRTLTDGGVRRRIA
jgi:hypothetical protein